MTQNMDGGLKAPLPSPMPQELASELALMRRDPASYEIIRRTVCGLGATKKGDRPAYEVAVGGEPAGAWCPQHGWLWFNTAGFPPTERLKPSELRDRQLALARKKGPRRAP